MCLRAYDTDRVPHSLRCMSIATRTWSQPTSTADEIVQPTVETKLLAEEGTRKRRAPNMHTYNYSSL